MKYEIIRPIRDGYVAFVRLPDIISCEFLQEGNFESKESCVSMKNETI
jgi:hypothetical protein